MVEGILEYMYTCSLSTELIQKSFCCCGIFANVDGSEGAEINYMYLKAGEVAACSCSSYYRLYSQFIAGGWEEQRRPVSSVDEEDEGRLEHTN